MKGLLTLKIFLIFVLSNLWTTSTFALEKKIDGYVVAKKAQAPKNLWQKTASEYEKAKKDIVRNHEQGFFPETKKSEDNQSQDIVHVLIAMGKKYEEDQQFLRAKDCYRAASLIDSTLAQQAIRTLEIKMKNEVEKKKQSEEIQALSRSAQQGNASDAYKLGKIYYKKNKIDDAIKMWVLAGDYKHAKAPYRLAQMFEKGEKVEIDLAKAEKYYRIGARNGHPECAYITSKLLEIEAKKNPQQAAKISEEAFHLKEEAANRGHALAAAEVGYMYAAQNEHIQARLYFEKAKKYAEPDATITVSLRQIMAYNILAEDVKIVR